MDRALRAQLNEGGSLHMDQRGKHTPANKTRRCDINRVKEHVETYSSHYSRHDNPNRCYLSPELSVAKMYQLYKEKCFNEGHNPVSSWVYRKIFNESFNLSFGVPKSDTCKTCDHLQVSIESETDSAARAQSR